MYFSSRAIIGTADIFLNIENAMKHVKFDKHTKSKESKVIIFLSLRYIMHFMIIILVFVMKSISSKNGGFVLQEYKLSIQVYSSLTLYLMWIW